MADLSLSSFKANFQSGARPNLYAVTISELGGGVEFLCKAASLPSSTIGQIEVPFRGIPLKMAGNRVFADWTVTILNDTDFAIRKAAELWMDSIMGHQTNVGAATIASYFRDAKVQQLDQEGNVVYTYEFKDIWPTEIGEVDLAMDSNDVIEEFTITFAVNRWESDGTNR